MNVTIENMSSVPKRKNLLEGGEEKTPSNPEKTSLPLDQFLEKMGVEWERRGRACYVYPSSLSEVKEILAKIPLPQPDEYIVIPLGQASGYSVFVMVTKSGVSIRVGYGRNSIPYVSALNGILEKVEKVAKEIGIESRKNGRNLLGV